MDIQIGVSIPRRKRQALELAYSSPQATKQMMWERRRKQLCRYLTDKLGQAEQIDESPVRAFLNSKGKRLYTESHTDQCVLQCCLDSHRPEGRRLRSTRHSMCSMPETSGHTRPSELVVRARGAHRKEERHRTYIVEMVRKATCIPAHRSMVYN